MRKATSCMSWLSFNSSGGSGDFVYRDGPSAFFCVAVLLLHASGTFRHKGNTQVARPSLQCTVTISIIPPAASKQDHHRALASPHLALARAPKCPKLGN